MESITPMAVAILLFVLGLSYLLQTGLWLSYMRRVMAQPERLFPMAMAMVVAGVIIGHGYNNWNGTWSIFVTVLGWLMVFKGVAILLLPNLLRHYQKLSDRFIRIYMRFGGLVLMILGVLLWNAKVGW
jgi:uncharacterized protein YjeT (DUF2065 family)